MASHDFAGEKNRILNALHGDEDAFAELVMAYERPVFNLCYRMLGEAGEAEDAAQEVFFKAYRNLRRYDVDRKFSTWLLSIASHHCIDQLRRKRLLTRPLDEFIIWSKQDEGDPGPEQTLSLKESEKEVQDMLTILRPEDRAALILLYWYDHSYEEIADLLSLSVPAVKSRLHRARREIVNQWPEETLVHVDGGPQDEPSTI